MSLKSQKPYVFIGWMNRNPERFGELLMCTLAWNGGKGPTRVYPKDEYDARLHLGSPAGNLPYFSDLKSAFNWMTASFGEQCQIDVKLAKALDVDIDQVYKNKEELPPVKKKVKPSFQAAQEVARKFQKGGD